MRYPHDVRIIGGTHRSRKIKLPENKDVRPTANRSREAIFNMLTHARNGMSVLFGARILDVFCGTGALGLESISRGAESATFIDIRTDLVTENIANLEEESRCAVLAANALELPHAPHKFDVIFLDPPYNEGLITPTLKNLIKNGWVEDRAVIVVESSTTEDYDVPANLEKFDERVYGLSRFSFFSKKAA